MANCRQVLFLNQYKENFSLHYCLQLRCPILQFYDWARNVVINELPHRKYIKNINGIFSHFPFIYNRPMFLSSSTTVLPNPQENPQKRTIQNDRNCKLKREGIAVVLILCYISSCMAMSDRFFFFLKNKGVIPFLFKLQHRRNGNQGDSSLDEIKKRKPKK